MLITGTSRGVGRGAAEHFARTGFKVIGCSRSPSTISHQNYHHFSLDLTVEVEVRQLASTIKDNFGRVDILVANLGLSDVSVFSTVLAATTTTKYEEFVRINFTSTFFMCREIVKLMIRQRYGRIVAISSLAAVLHQPGTAIYAATKAAVTELMKVMARELASSNITCNIIAPGLIGTELVASLSNRQRKQMLREQVVQELCSVLDICHAIHYLTSRDCGYLTGQVIDIGAIR
jgi:3-oxoacyl-[acyl-carrier protein] reductase